MLFPIPGLSSSGVTQEETAPPPPGREMATFSAGCFWAMQAMFQQLKGVDKADPGYSGGMIAHPSYDLVETGTTGYAESINVVFDPKVISYRQLVRIVLTARNPTTLDYQDPDSGTQYRSVIWYRTVAQQQAAIAEIREVNAEHIWSDPIVTTVEPFKSFWRAEDYHLNYFHLHPDEPYCAEVVAPEVSHFQQMYASLLKR